MGTPELLALSLALSLGLSLGLAAVACWSVWLFEKSTPDPVLREKAWATALYLYPTKALANDQLRVLQELEAATGLALGPAVYDRDGSELAARGLYLDLPAWGYHVFEVQPLG